MSSKTNTAATKEEPKRALVPKLRFPEFRGAEGWEPKRLGSVGQLTRGLTYSANDVASAGLLVLRSTNIQDGNLVLDQDLVFVGKPCPDALRLQAGDIVICMSNGSKALVGKSGEYSGEYEGDITVGAFCSFFRPAFPCAKVAFHLNSYQKYIADLIAGGNINNLTNSVLEEFRFPVPPLPAEQQKIADCLSSVDELMAAQARKVDALKTHKKGLMQQLFPREGETQPRLRFPEFRDAGEWEVQPLKKVFSIFQGFAFSSDDSVEQGCRWLKIADVGIQAMNHEAPSFLPESYKERFSKFAVRAGDYVVALTRPILSGQLKIAQVDDVFDGALLNQRVGKLITSQNPAFVFLLLQTKKLIGDIERSISGNDPPNLSAQQIEGLKAYVPSPAEQQRIATCLNSLDALITAETQKLEALKTHKKGLMQQLFPSPEEVAA